MIQNKTEVLVETVSESVTRQFLVSFSFGYSTACKTVKGHHGFPTEFPPMIKSVFSVFLERLRRRGITFQKSERSPLT
jgi:hypothetical protein